MRGGSRRPYIADIAVKHAGMGLPSPTNDPFLVLETRQGFLTQDTRRATGASQRSALFPAALASLALHRTLRAPDSASAALDVLRRYGLLALTLLLRDRSSSIRDLRRADIRFALGEAQLQPRRFKYNEAVPVAGAGTATGFLFPHALGRHALPAVFLNQTVSALLAATGMLAPLGMNYTPCSLGSGGISAGFRVGVPLALVMRLANHHDGRVVRRQYLDPQTRVTAAALFFDIFLSLVHGE